MPSENQTDLKSSMAKNERQKEYLPWGLTIQPSIETGRTINKGYKFGVKSECWLRVE